MYSHEYGKSPTERIRRSSSNNAYPPLNPDSVRPVGQSPKSILRRRQTRGINTRHAGVNNPHPAAPAQDVQVNSQSVARHLKLPRFNLIWLQSTNQITSKWNKCQPLSLTNGSRKWTTAAAVFSQLPFSIPSMDDGFTGWQWMLFVNQPGYLTSTISCRITLD